MEISSLIGKELLTPTGDKLGYVKNAYVSRDYKRLSSLICVDTEEEEFYLPARAVLADGDVIIAGRTRLPAPTGMPCPIGIPAYSEKGEHLGAVGDLLVGDGEPVYVIIKDGIRTSYDAECVVNGKTVIVYREGNKPKREYKPSPPVKKKAAQKPAPARTKKDVQPPKTQKAENNGVKRHEPTPRPQDTTTDVFNRCNLLGRRVKKSVYDETGAPIALSGERITAATISAARRHNKLLQLTVNTLTNLY